MIPMLRDSILSFRRYFNPAAEYVVFTDKTAKLRDILPIASVISFDSVSPSTFRWDGITPWKKWAPTARWAPGKAEIMIDADVFCVGVPTELINFCAQAGDAICTLQESVPEWWCYGVFRRYLEPILPRINAGLVAQQSAANIHSELESLYLWWQSCTTEAERTGHDEQGAIALIHQAAEKYRGTTLLPLDRYLLLSPRSNSDVQSLDGYAIIHTTYPHHPYYHRFRHLIATPTPYERT
jgi:hypothetical protein